MSVTHRRQYVHGPNLQTLARWTYANVTKKSDVRKVYEKTRFKK